MELSKLNWLYYIGCLTSKFVKEYTKKDWTSWKEYKLKFDYLWGTQTLWCKEQFFDYFNEWLFYIIKVWAFTRKDLDFNNINLIQKNPEIYEILDNWILEVTNTK